MNIQTEDEARRACERLAIEFAHAVDHREVERAVSVFTPDAVFERKGEQLEGRGAIRAAQQARPIHLVTRHLCASHRIEVIDGTHARGVVYFLLFRHEGSESDPPGPAPLVLPQTLGEYHDEYLRTDEGWKIARRVAKGIFRRAG